MIQNILNFLKKLIPIDLDSMVLESSENESNVYQKYGVAAAAGTAVALFSLFIMAFLIATGEVQLDEIKTRKIVDIVMPQRDPELLDSVERPEEAEPEPEQTPPEVDIENIHAYHLYYLKKKTQKIMYLKIIYMVKIVIFIIKQANNNIKNW